jgi:hypothetical protein
MEKLEPVPVYTMIYYLAKKKEGNCWYPHEHRWIVKYLYWVKDNSSKHKYVLSHLYKTLQLSERHQVKTRVHIIPFI